jgi:hypothetical protein
MSGFLESMVTIALALVALAALAVAVSRRANTTGVIQAGGSAFSNAVAEAISPVTGMGGSPVLSYPGSDFSSSFGYGQ